MGLFFIPSNLNNNQPIFQHKIFFLEYIKMEISKGLQIKIVYHEYDFTNLSNFIRMISECWLQYLIEECYKEKYQFITVDLIDKIIDKNNKKLNLKEK